MNQKRWLHNGMSWGHLVKRETENFFKFMGEKVASLWLWVVRWHVLGIISPWFAHHLLALAKLWRILHSHPILPCVRRHPLCSRLILAWHKRPSRGSVCLQNRNSSRFCYIWGYLVIIFALPISEVCCRLPMVSPCSHLKDICVAVSGVLVCH